LPIPESTGIWVLLKSCKVLKVSASFPLIPFVQVEVVDLSIPESAGVWILLKSCKVSRVLVSSISQLTEVWGFRTECITDGSCKVQRVMVSSTLQLV
jgi:hypothetical protein